MFGNSRRGGRAPRRWRAVVGMAAVAGLVTTTMALTPPATAAGSAVQMRVLVVDDGSVMVDAIAAQLDFEGVPHTDVSLSDPNRPQVTDGYLSQEGVGRFQAVVLPSSTGGTWTAASGLSGDEMTSIRNYQVGYGVRSVDAYDIPGPHVGLHPYGSATAPTWAGGLTGVTATVTAAGKGSGWMYLDGPVPFRIGSYAITSTPLTATSEPPMPDGAQFTPLVTVPIPGSSVEGSLIGAYSSGGVEQLVVNATFSAPLQQFRMLAHGIVTWATEGIHFGYNRNYYTQHFDDAFSYDARWNSTYKCTPGEDCPPGVNVPADDIRMTAGDVSALLAWQTANDYQPTLAFNAYHSLFDRDGNPWNGTDDLTNAFVAAKNSIRWLNHGYEHIYQGCNQDFSTVPWTCRTTDGAPAAADGSNISWTSQTDINSEITANITQGRALGLPFDAREYLSGEHSGLFLTPQQPIDNPGFGAALSERGITVIGADASRESGPRTVGSAITVPRHPVAVYYNVSTEAEEVSEYNWIYLSAADGGSGYCDANPATATCLAAPLDLATGFRDYILPTDVANDLRFILSNDPRPFYAHTSNLTGPDYLGLTLMSEILNTYQASFSTNAPLVNLSLTQASQALQRQQDWTTSGMPVGSAVTGRISNGVVTLSNPTGVEAPLTVPTGTLVNGARFGASYGGELSGWVAGGLIGTPPLPVITGPQSATFTTSKSSTVTLTAVNADTMSIVGALPAGVTFFDGGNGIGTISGTPTTGTAGTYAVTVTATNGGGAVSRAFVLTVLETPTFTSPETATFTVTQSGSFLVTTSGSPTPTLSTTSKLPPGLTFTDNGDGTGVLAGTPQTGSARDYTVQVSAVNGTQRATQRLVVTVQQGPAITSNPTTTMPAGAARTFTMRTSGWPRPVVSLSGALPAGVTFTPAANGTATLSGTAQPGSGGAYPLAVTATNSSGSVTQSFVLTVSDRAAFVSPATATVAAATPFAIMVTTTGSPTPQITVRQTPPVGITVLDHGDGTATVSGTVPKRGTQRVQLRATNAGGSANQTLTITAN